MLAAGRNYKHATTPIAACNHRRAGDHAHSNALDQAAHPARSAGGHRVSPEQAGARCRVPRERARRRVRRQPSQGRRERQDRHHSRCSESCTRRVAPGRLREDRHDVRDARVRSRRSGLPRHRTACVQRECSSAARADDHRHAVDQAAVLRARDVQRKALDSERLSADRRVPAWQRVRVPRQFRRRGDRVGLRNVHDDRHRVAPRDEPDIRRDD